MAYKVLRFAKFVIKDFVVIAANLQVKVTSVVIPAQKRKENMNKSLTGVLNTSVVAVKVP
jgi:hypothetical protein